MDVRADEVDDHRGQLIGIRDREGQRLRTPLHTGDVIVEAEDSRLAVAPAIGLEAFEAGARIVEDVGGGMHRQRCKRLDRRIAPAAVFESSDREMIAENGTELSHGDSNED